MSAESDKWIAFYFFILMWVTCAIGVYAIVFDRL